MQLFPWSGWLGEKLRAFCCLPASSALVPQQGCSPCALLILPRKRLQPLSGRWFSLNSPSLPIDLSDLSFVSPSGRVQPGSAASEIRENSRRELRISADRIVCCSRGKRIALDTIFCHVFLPHSLLHNI